MSNKNDSPHGDFISTPPTKPKVRNPFDKVLIDKLHQPICSPSMCKIYKKESRGSFRWDIDQECALLPTDIVACSSQFEPSPDPNLEKIAEEATEKFFSQEVVIPSPQETSKKVKPQLMPLIEKKITEIFKEKSVILKDVSAQTVLSLPPKLPPELEKMLQPYFTYTQAPLHLLTECPPLMRYRSAILGKHQMHPEEEQDMFGEYEVTANGSLRRKLYFEDHSDMEQPGGSDSEQTDEDFQQERTSPNYYEVHAPIVFSPDLHRDFAKKGMLRTFNTPLKCPQGKAYRNKILDVEDFGGCLSPIQFSTPPKRIEESSASSLASESISPVAKLTSSDEDKANFTSPESAAMATCLDCVTSDSDRESAQKGRLRVSSCFFKSTPNHASLKRSASFKETPPRSRKTSATFTGKRSLSLSSLHRSRSVQKLDFSMNMSVDASLHLSQAESPSRIEPGCWALVARNSSPDLVESQKEQYNLSAKKQCVDILDNTPVKGKTKSIGRHEVSKIRTQLAMSPINMSLDNSLDNSDNPLSLEDKKMDFNSIDLKLLTENITKFDYTAADVTKNADSSSFKKVDSGFNENTFYTNGFSYYESAIRPSELTITNSNATALKEISNVHWARVDSGFKDETSSDNTHFYANSENPGRPKCFRFTEAKVDDKENYISEDFSRFLGPPTNKHEVMSMSDVFPEDMTFTSNFSSTPTKSKPKNLNS